MQPQNIDLLSQINTSEEGLLSKEPMFDEKNSLMYKGIVSNMTVDKGDGILSTTGKNIKIEGNTLTAGNQVFSINNDFTVEPFDSGICGEDDIAIEETVVSSSKEVIEFSRAGEVFKSIKLTGVDKVWKSTVWNFSYFAFVYKKGNTFEFEMRDTAGDVVTSGNSITFTENDHFTPGNTLTAIVLNNLYAFGFNDLDYRKRFTVSFKAGVKKVYRGFGNISSNGMVFGEPVPCVLSRQGSYYGCGSVYLGDVKEENPLFSVQGGPNIYDVERYKILDNGVISLWSGWFNPDTKSSNGQTYLEMITNENAALGETLQSNSGTQLNSSRDNWHPKLHAIRGTGSLEFPNGQEAIGSSTWGNNKDYTTIADCISNTISRGILIVDSGNRYKLASRCGLIIHGKQVKTVTLNSTNNITVVYSDNSSEDITDTTIPKQYCVALETTSTTGSRDAGKHYWYQGGSTDDHQMRSSYTTITWSCGVDLINERRIDLGSAISTSSVKPTTTFEYEHSTSLGLHFVNFFGDWTYNYNSMKAFKDITDYDAVFPGLRIFFNNANAKGKYYDYGNGWFRCYRWSLGWNQTANEVNVTSTPLTLITITNSKDNSGQGIYQKESKVSLAGITSADSWKEVSENTITNLASVSTILEPLGNEHVCATSYDTPVSNVETDINYLEVFSDYWKKEGTKIKIPHTAFMIYKEVGRLIYNSRRIDILGSGNGLENQTFNFGGIGNNTLLPTLNFTNNLLLDKPDTVTLPSGKWYNGLPTKELENTDLLRVQVYNGLEVALTYKGNLLFSAGEMEHKYHFFEDDDGLHITLYSGKKYQSIIIKEKGTIKLDKLSDYIYRLNVLGTENLLLESHEGAFSLVRGFNGFLGEDRMNVVALQMRLPAATVSSNNVLYYAAGVNTQMLKEDKQPSFLLPASTFASYIFPNDNKAFENTVLTNRNSFIKQLILDKANEIDVYYTSSNSTTDNTYKETDIIPEGQVGTFESFVGVQSFNEELQDATYWVNGTVILYPAGIASKFSGINYATSTVELPDNYSARMYNNNNKTWVVYDQNSQIYYGSNIFTVMGGNYYFDKQGIYYVGDAKYGNQYNENVLIAYAVGMEFLCSAPSEAYFYSPFDKCLYIFTAANTMQKANSLARFGKIIDSCYSPVNQSIYILFEGGKLYIKSQDDSALIDVEGNKLLTTSNGVQVTNYDNSYEIHSPYMFEDNVPLKIETEFLGNPDFLSKYSWVDVVLFKQSDSEVKLNVAVNTVAKDTVKETISEVTIKPNQWQNGFYRLRLTPTEPVGNAIQIKVNSEDKVGVYNMTVYMESVSVKNAASDWR